MIPYSYFVQRNRELREARRLHYCHRIVTRSAALFGSRKKIQPNQNSATQRGTILFSSRRRQDCPKRMTTHFWSERKARFVHVSQVASAHSFNEDSLSRFVLWNDPVFESEGIMHCCSPFYSSTSREISATKDLDDGNGGDDDDRCRYENHRREGERRMRRKPPTR